MTSSSWPFDDPPNTASITLRRILEGGNLIRLVNHSSHDGMWQFLDGDPVDEQDAVVVGLGTVLRHDPSVAEVATLPLGQRAWRDSEADPWTELK